MKWTGEYDVMLGRRIILFELWKYMDVVAKETSVWIELQSLNQSKKPCFKVSQKSSQ